jgi:hypothetical protein
VDAGAQGRRVELRVLGLDHQQRGVAGEHLDSHARYRCGQTERRRNDADGRGVGHMVDVVGADRGREQIERVDLGGRQTLDVSADEVAEPDGGRKAAQAGGQGTERRRCLAGDRRGSAGRSGGDLRDRDIRLEGVLDGQEPLADANVLQESTQREVRASERRRGARVDAHRRTEQAGDDRTRQGSFVRRRRRRLSIDSNRCQVLALGACSPCR